MVNGVRWHPHAWNAIGNSGTGSPGAGEPRGVLPLERPGRRMAGGVDVDTYDQTASREG